MKKRLVEKTKPTTTRKSGHVATVQFVKDILILNMYQDKKLYCRYCMNVTTGEYAQWMPDGIWENKKLNYICGGDRYYHCNAYRGITVNSKQEEQLITDSLKNYTYMSKPMNMIDSRETQFNIDTNQRAYDSKQRRINEEIDAIPRLPDMSEWLYELIGGQQDFAFWDKDSEKYRCTNCGVWFDGKYKNNQKMECPSCDKQLIVKKRMQRKYIQSKVMVIDKMDDNRTAIRLVDVRLEWETGSKRYVNTSVAAVIVAYKNREYTRTKRSYRLYYNQDAMRYDFDDSTYKSRGWGWSRCNTGGFWDSNPASRKTFGEYYLYPNGIEALEGTIYGEWTNLFKQLAAAGKCLHYNNILTTCYVSQDIKPMIEYLFKGRFHRLLYETTEHLWPHMSYLQKSYDGILNPEGRTIEEVFRIDDRQVINRIRDMNGGEKVARWLSWAHHNHKKISQETLDWLIENDIDQRELSMTNKMSPQQIMNYIIKQQDSYPNKTPREIIEQWKDYLSMCVRLNKKMDDEMVYRPRELKRRHDEAALEIHRQQVLENMARNKDYAKQKEEQMREQYPHAEEILREVKAKYEYNNEEYLILVPERLMDIELEGLALHHCVSASSRYYDRIESRETYICFLRKQEEPDVPFYTIEVEPGGTIRQHRSYLDEEPGIELIKPFLKEWQKVIKKRLTEKDRKYAAISEVKRQENINELIAKNNKRVLDGLMEDFMEAV